MIFEKKMNALYLLLILIDFILIGGILPLLERKILSLVQRRVGPYYVGYKGRLQFLADALKVFFKEFIYLAKINNSIYLLLPLFYFYLNLILFFLFIYSDNVFYIDMNYYIIYMYIILIYSNIILFFSGLFSKNKYSILSASRIVFFIFSLDILFSIFIIILILLCESFDFQQIQYLKSFGYFNFLGVLLLPMLIIIFLLDANKAPYDLFEAESELINGYAIEYSGFLFGIYILVEYLHILFFSYIIINIFF